MQPSDWHIYAAKLKHEEVSYSSPSTLVPIVVGAHSLTESERQELRNSGHAFDDEGENISALNPFFAELTSVYWMLHNCKDHEYIGNAHYRRKWADRDIVHSEPNVFYVSHAYEFRGGLARQFMDFHNNFDAPKMTIDLAERGLIPLSASQLKAVWEQEVFYGCQMARGPRKHYAAFMTLAFDCLWPFWEEYKDEIVALDSHNRRMIGFVGERIMTALILCRDSFFDFPIATSRVELVQR